MVYAQIFQRFKGWSVMSFIQAVSLGRPLRPDNPLSHRSVGLWAEKGELSQTPVDRPWLERGWQALSEWRTKTRLSFSADDQTIAPAPHAWCPARGD